MNIYFLSFGDNENRFLPLLSDERRKKADGIAAAVRREKIYSYALLRYALFSEYGYTAPPAFNYGEKGKPFLSELSDIFFSISHANGCTACVLAGFPVGLDIQDIRPLKADISHKICTENELEAVNKSENPPQELCRLWCIKESFGKLTGKGFSEGFTKIDTEKLIKNEKTAVIRENNFFVSVSSEKEIGETEIIKVKENELLRLFKI